MCFLLDQDPGVQHYGGEMFQVLRPETGEIPGGQCSGKSTTTGESIGNVNETLMTYYIIPSGKLT